MYSSRGSIQCPIIGMSHVSFFQVNLISKECILCEDHSSIHCPIIGTSQMSCGIHSVEITLERVIWYKFCRD